MVQIPFGRALERVVDERAILDHEVLAVIRALAETGMTMLIVTHEVRFAREVADRIVFMDDGVIIEEGPPAGLLDKPEQERTRRFLQMVARGDEVAA